ncbi:hypothetical protein DT73_25360 [Mangrovibacter sp. MFB070]|nr:hypothetical protein DT73_25360 [Mangrovibacter sp. MFB070]
MPKAVAICQKVFWCWVCWVFRASGVPYFATGYFAARVSEVAIGDSAGRSQFFHSNSTSSCS